MPRCPQSLGKPPHARTIMIDSGVVLDDVGLALHAARGHSEHGVGLITRDNFVTDVISNIFFVKYYVVASITLLYFDHAITFPLEVRRVWSTRFTGASFLFLLNRYVPFFGYIPVLMSLFNPPWNINQCRRFAPFISALTIFSNVVAALILILRTYALYSRALWVLLVTSTFGAASVAVGAWSAKSVEGELFTFQPIVVCVPMLIHDHGLKFAWIMTFVFDFVVFSLTIARTYMFMRNQRRMQVQSDLTMLLMRDGSIYFLVMSAVNAVNFILSTRIRNSFFASATGTNSILANVISITMISRLLLNLREESVRYNHRISGQAPSDPQTLTDTNLIFTSRIFGNLTADLEYGSAESSSRGRRRGSENYYTYDYDGEDSDELYELQSRSTRSGLTSRSGYSGRTVSTDPGSSSGTGTIAGSSSGSGSGSGSAGKSRRDKDCEGERRESRLGWAASVNTASSSAGTRRRWVEEPQTPAITVEPNSHLLPFGERTPQLLSPLSPDTSHSLSPTLYHASPSSHYSRSPLSRNYEQRGEYENETQNEEITRRDDRGRYEERDRPHEQRERVHFEISVPGDAIEMSNLERRARSPEGSHEHDVFHDHYRRGAPSRPES